MPVVPRNGAACVFAARRQRCRQVSGRRTMAETRIGVVGCGGRMGRMLIADIVATEGCTLAGGVARPGSSPVGQDLGELAGIGRLGIAAGDNADQLLRDCDVAIEFTAPAAT